jgi:hypothetical protein
MSGLIGLAITVLPVSIADLLLFLHWYHLSNAQAKFLLYGPWLAHANQRFAASGFVAGSLVLLAALSLTLVVPLPDRGLKPVPCWKAALLNAVIVGPGGLFISKTANFDPPLWTVLVAIFWLLALNAALFAVWQYFARIASTITVSLLMIAGFGLSATALFAFIQNTYPLLIWEIMQHWMGSCSILLSGMSLPVFLILAVGALWGWRCRCPAWRCPRIKSLCLGVWLLWVPCFAAAHYALASNIHYITNVENLLKNTGFALVCAPVLSGLLTLADTIVSRRLLSAHKGTQTEHPSLSFPS